MCAKIGLAALVLAAFLPIGRVGADAVDDWAAGRMRRAHIPGLAVVVVRDGKVIKLGGYGQANLDWPSPVTPETRFQLASVTKPLTGALLLSLVEDGKLGLDDPVARHISDAPAAWRGMTVRHLVTHCAGLKEEPDANPDEDVAAVVARLKKAPLDFPIGTRARYGNNDFVVLTHILQQVSGKSFPQLLADRLLRPLGIDGRFDFTTQEGPVRRADPLKGRATVYHFSGEQRQYWYHYGRKTYAAGGIYASAADLARFVVALDSGKLLRPAALAQLFTARPLADGSPNDFAAGWIVGRYRGRPIVGHSGGPALADVLRFPDDKLTFVVLTNQHHLYPNLAQELADLYVPPPPFLNDKGMADADPAASAVARRVLEQMARGALAPALFSREAQADLVPALNDMGPLIIGWPQPLTDLVLLGESSKGASRTRRYRARYGDKTLRCTFTFTGDRVASLETEPE